MNLYIERMKGVLGLSFSLALSRFKDQNEGSYLGVLWYLLDPIFLFTIIFFVHSAAYSADVVPHFPVYLLIGLLFLNFFTKTTSDAIIVVEKNAAFIKNMLVSHEALVFSNVLQRLFMHLFEIIILVAIMIIWGGSFSGLAWYPLILILFLVFLTGASFILASIGAYIKDFANLWAPFTRLLIFATPIFFQAQPGSLMYSINDYNPIFYFITVTRDLVAYDRTPSLHVIIGMISFTILTYLIGLFIFKKAKPHFPELI